MNRQTGEPSCDCASFTVWVLGSLRCVMTCYVGTSAFQLSIFEGRALVNQHWFTDTEQATEFAINALPTWARTLDLRQS